MNNSSRFTGSLTSPAARKLTRLPTLPTLSAITAELARRRLSHFVREAWPVLNPGRALE